MMGAINAKKTPIINDTNDIPHIHQLALRNVMQVFACCGSAGQGIFRARHNIIPANKIIRAATPNTHNL